MARGRVLLFGLDVESMAGNKKPMCQSDIDKSLYGDEIRGHGIMLRQKKSKCGSKKQKSKKRKRC